MPSEDNFFLPELCVFQAKSLLEIAALCMRGNSHGLQLRLSVDRGLSPAKEYVGSQRQRGRNKRKSPAKTYVISISDHDRSYAVRPYELSVERKWREGKKRTYGARVLARLTSSLREVDELEMAAETYFRKHFKTLSDLESTRGRISRCVARIEKHAKRIDSAVTQANLGESFSGWCASRNGIFPVSGSGALDLSVNENLRIRAAKVTHSIVKHNRLMARADKLVTKLWTPEAAHRRDALDKLWCEIKSIVLDFSIEGELSLSGMNLNVLEGEDVPAFTHEKILDPTVEKALRNNTLIDSEDVSTEEEEAEPEAKKATFEVKLRYAKRATEVSAGPDKDGTSGKIATGPRPHMEIPKVKLWACQPCRAERTRCVKEKGHDKCLRCIEYSLACMPQENINGHAESSKPPFQLNDSDAVTKTCSGQSSPFSQDAPSNTLPTLSELANAHSPIAGNHSEPGPSPEGTQLTDEMLTSENTQSSVSGSDEAKAKDDFERASSPVTSLVSIKSQPLGQTDDLSSSINGSLTELCMEQTRLMKASQKGPVPGCLESFTTYLFSGGISVGMTDLAYFQSNVRNVGSLSGGFNSWREKHERSEENQIVLDKNLAFFNSINILKSGFFLHWIDMTRKIASAADKGVDFHRTLLHKNSLIAWYEKFITKARCLSDIADKFISKHEYTRSIEILRKWNSTFTKNVRRNQQTFDMFAEKWERNNLKTSFELWHEKARERFHIEDEYAEANTTLGPENPSFESPSSPIVSSATNETTNEPAKLLLSQTSEFIDEASILVAQIRDECKKRRSQQKQKEDRSTHRSSTLFSNKSTKSLRNTRGKRKPFGLPVSRRSVQSRSIKDNLRREYLVSIKIPSTIAGNRLTVKSKHGSPPKRTFVCPHCRKYFSSRPNLDTHARLSHSNASP
ncbi:hypothetical protein OXX80_002554 [Metschnikowia pulcherrima]